VNGAIHAAGKNIDDAAFTSLVERLTMIGLVCGVATESFERLSKDELLSMLDQIRSCSIQGLAFTGATSDETKLRGVISSPACRRAEAIPPGVRQRVAGGVGARAEGANVTPLAARLPGFKPATIGA
jgi:hypothetical protein